ncbi:hypothetical protein JRO89_XS13G0195200 [Xanthoceras sorbifolium]|uniref:non-specific serine/threonine protein kinase n=1 Tax=Xanthoceras sorbifolium TaxID=99658 RepID=A0ABQ8H985_9ROSI|nr:hypothetical protein JRO89_XS13G0195200 [Xanthoceras sorbifolium]
MKRDPARSRGRDPARSRGSKYAKPSSYGSKSRSTSVKARDVSATSSATPTSTSLWDKVYWLSIDYLVVAKAAVLPYHVEILVSAVTQINEPDSLYGIIQSHKHEGNWSKALEYYELQVRSNAMVQMDGGSRALSAHMQSAVHLPLSTSETEMRTRKPYKGLIRSLQQIGCMHVLDMYCQGLTSQKGQFQHDLEFTELQYEAAWRAGNWDFSLLYVEANSPSGQYVRSDHFNENLHSCLRALQEGDPDEFLGKLKDSKQELVLSVSRASEESTEYIYSTIIKLQILYHLGVAWDIRWKPSSERTRVFPKKQKTISEPVIPTMNQLSWLNVDWNSILGRTQLHMNLLEPFIAFRRVLLQILSCKDSTMQHLLQSASTLRKGSRFSQTAAALHELKFLCAGSGEQYSTLYWLGRLEEAKLLRAQGQHEMAINLAKYISENYQLDEEAPDVHRLVGNSRTILEKYLKPAVSLAEDQRTTDKKSIERQCQTHFHLAHYADALFRSYEERLTSNEWLAAMRLRKHKTVELEALIRQLRSSTKGNKIDYSVKIQELQKQLSMDKEEAEKLLDDRDNFLGLALEGYKRCLVTGDKYDVRVVFRLLSLWFSLSSRQNVIDNMLITIDEVQSYKFIPLVYQIASRMGSSKDDQGSHNFQFALVSLVKKMAIDHPYHTIFQLLALANGDRIKDKQRSRNSFVVDMDKKLAAENLLEELSSYHGPIIRQMKQMVEIYIKLAELETRREDTNRRITLPREIRSLRQLELEKESRIMNGINAPKVVECLGSDGCKYKQLAKSGNDDLRQDAHDKRLNHVGLETMGSPHVQADERLNQMGLDANLMDGVMEQVFGLVNTFLRNHRDTWKRRLGVRTYKHKRWWCHGRPGRKNLSYSISSHQLLDNGNGHMQEKDKRGAFQEVCENFRPVMHYFFLEKFLQPADWFEKRLAYTRSVAASSMLLALANGDRIKDKQRSRNSFVVDMDKKLAAENLLEELSSYHGPIIRQMKQMVEIYIKLAELETRREDTNRRITLPREIRSLRQLELEKESRIMNGINAPKVVECLGSDGCKYKQLAKSGNDDLRQDAHDKRLNHVGLETMGSPHVQADERLNQMDLDANLMDGVMEQVFGLVNTFLRNHRDTWKRRLGVRTYKVVPFTPSAGVLEWVDGTLPLGEYLIGSTRDGGAHGRPGRKNLSYSISSHQLLDNGNGHMQEKDKRGAFQEVCENFRPVMHYFFLEKFLQPADWFEKRLAYTRSVAASSMVGYIVGLGDRHSMNILIDQATAEVVHIDLGVAFEQGLMLKTPERVPFRLSRDIIDGMGVTGVEGVFRRCCEKTLSVMQANKEALLTIVEVFIHDPLYKWALSPLKALQRQKERDDDSVTSLGGSQDEYEGNKDAARALMRVKQKLDGYEEGEMRSVHGQPALWCASKRSTSIIGKQKKVQQLIQDAIDPERLCQMFPGWGAWL